MDPVQARAHLHTLENQVKEFKSIIATLIHPRTPKFIKAKIKKINEMIAKCEREIEILMCIAIITEDAKAQGGAQAQ